MTPEQFCYWLQGRAEMQPDIVPTPQEWAMIVAHLQTVFVKTTPASRFAQEYNLAVSRGNLSQDKHDGAALGRDPTYPAR